MKSVHTINTRSSFIYHRRPPSVPGDDGCTRYVKSGPVAPPLRVAVKADAEVAVLLHRQQGVGCCRLVFGAGLAGGSLLQQAVGAVLFGLLGSAV